jgi:hypothetical protein
MNRTSSLLACSLAGMVLLAGAARAHTAPAAAPVLGAQPAAVSYADLIKNHAGALVTVKFILKSEGAGDTESEIPGLVIDGSGLVLVSSSEIGGIPPQFAAMMGGRTPTPTDIKVLVGEDTQGVEAKLIARDSELDLAWIRVDKAPETPWTALDFAKGGEPALGDPILALFRSGKFFDRAPRVIRTTLSGETRKPRHLLFPSGMDLFQRQCTAIFDASGKVVGVTTVIFPDPEEMESMQRGGGMNDMLAGTILPAKEVAEATARALESAAKNPPAETEPAPAPAGPAPEAAPGSANGSAPAGEPKAAEPK